MVSDCAFLAEHLERIGYLVYPTELSCGCHDTPHDQGRWVDVAAYRNGGFYAFEYKSSGDPISGAVKQIENYRNSFDFVILLVEIPRKGRSGLSLNSRRGKRIYDIVRLGAGIWIASKNHAREVYDIREIAKPRIQTPNSLNRKYIERLFWMRYKRDSMMRPGGHPSQQKLDHYTHVARTHNLVG
ncbi:MAG: hypothetical protein NTX81_00845 [Candidatus Bathyarchaeota archaeon]|jgi:hypothetical protein|nr:hypothetical protein [Candidatus Bathyarchaeota archaeon]